MDDIRYAHECVHSARAQSIIMCCDLQPPEMLLVTWFILSKMLLISGMRLIDWLVALCE